MSKYDKLDPRKELEQIVTDDLVKALGKRGFSVKHNGAKDNQATGNKADIEVWDNKTHIVIEVTKTKKSQADREFLSIKDHLEQIKYTNPKKRCFCIYVSPETHYRMINAILLHNGSNKKKDDLKILPITFSTFELFITRLSKAHKDEYSKKQILSIFEKFNEYTSDEKVLRLFYEHYFPTDEELLKKIETEGTNKNLKIEEELIRNFNNIENKMREYGIATSGEAIKNLIYLVFMKLFEEKRQKDQGKKNRFTEITFLEYQEDVGQEEDKGAIKKLFIEIKNSSDFKKNKIFDESDVMARKLNDDFILKEILPIFDKQRFYQSKVDALGAVYEVLAQRSNKDVKAGQFFTPYNVVEFMVRLTNLHEDDKVLDPACGTGRFLVVALDKLAKKKLLHSKGKTMEDITKEIGKNLFGSDFYYSVAKLAKMNMYISGDGRTNILSEDGLLLYKKEYDGSFDVILTNPPLGDTNYLRDDYDDDFKLKRMEIIPKRNITQDKLDEYNKRQEEYENKLKGSQEKQNLTQVRNISRKIKEIKEKIVLYKNLIEQGEARAEVTGKQMKGGSLFLNACMHYLKIVSNKKESTEWKGGKLLIILDEGILNTDNYKKTRDFIRKYFYIKAIISLTKDTFVPVSNTSTKTSIVYLIKKDDIEAEQKEPIFYAHATMVGINTKKKACQNDLFNHKSGKDILSKFEKFEKNVKLSYIDGSFNKAKFDSLNLRGGNINE